MIFTSGTQLCSSLSPPITATHPCNLPLKQNKTKNKTEQKKKKHKQNETKHKNHLIMEAVVCHNVSHTHVHLQMFIAMSHWSGSRSLASVTPSISVPHWDSSLLSCGCPMSWRSSSLGQQDLLFYTTQEFIDDVELRYHGGSDLGL